MSAPLKRTWSPNADFHNLHAPGFVWHVAGLISVIALDPMLGCGSRDVESAPVGPNSEALADNDVPPHDTELPPHLVAYDTVAQYGGVARETSAERPVESAERNCNPPYTVDPPTGKKRWLLECLAMSAGPPEDERALDEVLWGLRAAPSANGPRPAPGLMADVGLLTINSIPPSTCFVDGKPFGATPKVRVTVLAGAHQVKFVGADPAKTKTVYVTVEPGGTAMATANLNR
jgi:hypothetical protein